MSAQWISTPTYRCRYCDIPVRDTPLERRNHESTAKHQGAVRRWLRNLHHEHDRAEAERERARREVARLNGVVSGPSHSPFPATATPTRQQQQQPSEEERRRQMEQLAALGVAIPEELRAGVAMAGEWQVTKTRVVGEGSETPAEARATGVRKREREGAEEEREEERVVSGLFKKSKRWGRDTKMFPGEGDEELEELLSGPLVSLKKEEMEVKTKEEEVKKEEANFKVGVDLKQEGENAKTEEVDVKRDEETVKKEGGDIKHEEDNIKAEGGDVKGEIGVKKDRYVKQEEEDVRLVDIKAEDREPLALSSAAPKAELSKDDLPFLEQGTDEVAKVEEGPSVEDGTSLAATVVFKKRKPKNIRQR